MKLVSWNVNGLRSAVGKGFYDFFKDIDADIFCIQETKMQQDQIDNDMKKLGNYQYWNSAEKKGYSGTAMFCKIEPQKITFNTNDEIIKNNAQLKILGENKEGRIITGEYKNFYMVNCYTPNSKRELERLEYRMKWEDALKEYLYELDKIKPVIYCGDLNVAHKEIDLKNPSSNHHNAGFTDEERNKMTNLLSLGFIDTFRYMYPEKRDEYSWWSYMFHAREKNAGWRIDYFIISDRIKDKIKCAKIHQEILGSDHCPIELEIEI